MTATPETADQYADQHADSALANAAQNQAESISIPAGFKFGSGCGGIKPSGRPDTSLVIGDGPMIVAGVYTKNAVIAAPVTWCRDRTPSDQIRGIVTVSGNANACTGARGESDNAAIAARMADRIGCNIDQVLVMSTGIIGRFLPMEKVNQGIDSAFDTLNASSESFLAAAEAIRTTDKDRKVASKKVTLSGQTYTISAMCKGAGMIAPDMATLLALITTDAPLSSGEAQTMLRSVVGASFNRTSVDGHTSTNDTLLLACSGVRGSERLSESDRDSLREEITHIAVELSKQLVADGEGATHYMAITVCGAADDAAAETVARTVAGSQLVKTAITGADPNWGRIVSAAGYAGVSMDVAKTELRLCGKLIYSSGTPEAFDAAELSALMKSKVEIPIELRIGDGPGEATFWSSDLTTDYVRFNSEYTT